MDIGRVGVFAGLVASLLAIVLYALSLTGNRKLLWAARTAFGVTALSVFFCFFRLMYLVSHHRFEFGYVFKYSSADLGFPWKYAATWAGQEGSFLLWAFWTAVIGILVAAKAGKWESRVMPFYITTLAFLFGILVWLNPYLRIHVGMGPTDYPPDLPYPPLNGQGINPSLQNYWMAIHPPTIFFGFSSLCVGFSYAVAAMIWRDYRSWAERVMPYVLLTVATLGVGLVMGGYWAYETQGWHGFWGWDPVENASFFPWLASVGLLHGLVVLKSRGGMGRASIFLSVVAWLMFLWGTFLTRSGVLADFSVHAFDMLGKDALALIEWMIVAHGMLGFTLLIIRWRTVPGRPISDRLLTRDTAMVLAISLMVMAAFTIAIITSWPLISRWTFLKHVPILSHYQSARGFQFQPKLYNIVGAALLIPALLTMGLVPFLAWGKTNAEKFLWKVLTPWLSAVGVGALIVWFVWGQEAGGFHPATPRMLVVVIGMLGMFAAIANASLVAKLVRPLAESKGRRILGYAALASSVVGLALLFELSLAAWMVLVCVGTIVAGFALLRAKGVAAGGWVAHVGIGVFFVGAILTNVYEQTQSYDLEQGAQPTRTPYGYALQFAGWTSDGKDEDTAAREWFDFGHSMKVNVTSTKGDSNVVNADDGTAPAAKTLYTALVPVFRQHSLQMRQDSSQQYMCWPSIHRELFRDFYIVPATDPEILYPRAELGEGQVAAIGMPHDRFIEHSSEGDRIGYQVTDTGYRVAYKQFYMHGAPGQPGTAMGAELDVIAPDGRHAPARAEMLLTDQGMQPTTVQIPELNAACRIEGGINPATKQVTVNFELPEFGPRWSALVSVTNKPLINVVWLGVILMAVGTIISMVRRSREARRGALIQEAAAAGITEDADPAMPEPSSQSVTNGANGHHTGAGKASGKRTAAVPRA